jgi:putative aminopeptidase FrvX
MNTIILSAHMDLARPVMSIQLNDKHLHGLVDNFAGVFAAYQASRKTGVPVHFTNYEELDFDGAQAVAKSLDADSLVIVVDTILETHTHGKAASITNAYGLEEYWPDMKKTFASDIHFIDGLFEETEDETWIYGNKHGLKTFYFGIPIPGDYYHSTECSVSLETIDEASRVLSEVVEYFSAPSSPHN